MRRRRCRRALRASALPAFVLVGSGATPLALRGQVEESGVQTLLLPISARAVGVGGAHVADGVGTDAVATNPSALAWLARREAGVYYGQEGNKDFGTSRIMASVAWPVRTMGTFAVSAWLADLGTDPVSSGSGEQTGRFAARDVFYAASYGSSLGPRLALGVTYKYFQRRFDCTGDCNPDDIPAFDRLPSGSTSAVDLGLQYDAGPRVPLVLGVAVRHLGQRLQAQDEPQADRLPTQASIGARYQVPNLARRVPDTEVKLLAEYVSGLGSTTRELRVGAEAAYRKSFFVRGGYNVVARGGAGGPAFGVGYVGRRLAFDLARHLAGVAADAGQPPTYVSLRYWF